MRILQLKTSAARGGAEALLLQLTAGLAARGHEVATVLGEPGWLRERLADRGLTASVVPLVSWAGLLRVPKLAGLIRSLQADVVLSHGARVNLFGTLAASLSGVPAVSVEHNMDSWRGGNPVFGALDRLVAAQNRGRIAVSRAVAGMLVERNVLPPDRIEVIPNGVSFPAGEPAVDRRAVRAGFGLADEDFVLVTVARLTAQKGHRHLLGALPALRERIPRLRCLCLGEGDLRPELEALCRRLGLDDAVVFAGAVDGVMGILPACDLFVLPSLWEGLPLAVVEAMGVGLPVIATDVAGTPEAVESGRTGLLVPPGDPGALADAVLALHDDEELRGRLAGEGRRRAREEFGIDAVVDRYEEALGRWSRR
jgi:glycosyltransferase involved in cell wall biosynthesis